MELNDFDSEMKRIESGEECNDFKNGVKGYRIISFGLLSHFPQSLPQLNCVFERATDMSRAEPVKGLLKHKQAPV